MHLSERIINEMIIAALVLSTGHFQSTPKAQHYASQRFHAPIKVGWNDELNNKNNWTALDMDNKAAVVVPTKGALLLALSEVPKNWPYDYQWSGVSQDAKVNVGEFPVLSARVYKVEGYAHMDIDVLDAEGKPTKTLRSSTLTSPGLSTIDLGKELDSGTYSLRLRLIVGGPNSGCEATYNWVRFTNRTDAEFLSQHPEWQKVIPAHLWGSLR